MVWKHFWLTKLGHLFISLLSELIILLCQLSNFWQRLFHDILPSFLIACDEKLSLVPVTASFCLGAQLLRAVYSKAAFPHIPGLEIGLQCHLWLLWSWLHLCSLCLFEFGSPHSPPRPDSDLTRLLDSLFLNISVEGFTDLLRDLDLPLTQQSCLLCCAWEQGYYPFKHFHRNRRGEHAISLWLVLLSLLVRLNFAPNMSCLQFFSYEQTQSTSNVLFLFCCLRGSVLKPLFLL